jgi:hypothetical protein
MADVNMIASDSTRFFLTSSHSQNAACHWALKAYDLSANATTATASCISIGRSTKFKANCHPPRLEMSQWTIQFGWILKNFSVDYKEGIQDPKKYRTQTHLQAVLITLIFQQKVHSPKMKSPDSSGYLT